MPETKAECKPFPFTMGADPEFSFIMNNKRIDAQKTMTAMIKNVKGLVNEGSKGFKVGDAGYAGWDGCSSTAELRPKPSATAEGLSGNLGKIFEGLYKAMGIMDASTLSIWAPIGGHIHLSLPERLHGNSTEIKRVHQKLASFFVPVIMGENKPSLQIRMDSGYGKLTDYHDDNQFGKVRTYEMRCPSAEWLTTEKIARSVLAYVGTIYNEILNHPRNFNKYSKLTYRTDKQGEALQIMAVSEFGSAMAGMMKEMAAAVRTFEFYEQYKEEIEYVLKPEKILADKRKAGYSIFKGWGLKEEDNTEVTKELLTDPAKVAEERKKIDIDNVSGVIPIYYNNDTNVEMFAKEIGNRMLASKWNPKNTYFFYGIRKGIDGFIISDKSGNMFAGQEMIKSKMDISAIGGLLSKMVTKFLCAVDSSKDKAVELFLAKILGGEAESKLVMIGIPYAIRAENNFGEVAGKIFDIEKGVIKEAGKLSDMSFKDIIEDTEESPKGELSKAFFRKKQTQA